MKTHQKTHLLSHLFTTLLTLIVSAVVLLWAWNTVMPEILGLAAIQYKHALALAILGFGFSFLFTHRSHRRHLPGPHPTTEQICKGAM